ncbi:MAG TPA: pyridoxamine 5'-phosphate oxidase [Gammaproteobacteria bacterium]|nr:pyridoxamine 5'-phosphate oxidase [Gammaproteobacteria bacterium]
MDELYEEALSRFGEVYARAGKCGITEPNAMNLATVDGRGRPSSRVVLLKGYDERGFVFYTNHNSRKGQDLAAVPRAALCFYWEPLLEQVRIEGTVETVSERDADAYWATRPRNSQISAWASQQSEPLDSSAALERRMAEITQKYRGRSVPRPSYWSGYRVVPDLIEFWRGGEYLHRIHERTCYRRQGDAWTVNLLNP